MLVTRVILLLTNIGMYIEYIIANHQKDRLNKTFLAYLTSLGGLFTIIYFLLTVIAYLPCCDKPSERDGSSPWHLWKWCVAVFSVIFNIELMVTLVFWIMLFPTLTIEGTIFNYYSMHIVPLVSLFIDLSMSAILIEFNQILINFAIDILYFSFLVAYTKIN